MSKGTAIMDVVAESLSVIVTILPSTYCVVGSEDGPERGVVRLVVESDDIAGHDMHLKCEITDVGSTRTVVMVPCGRRGAVKG